MSLKEREVTRFGKEKNKGIKRIYKLMDFICVCSVILLFVQLVLLSAFPEMYEPQVGKRNNHSSSFYAILATMIPFGFSMIWLPIRYAEKIANKYPIIKIVRFRIIGLVLAPIILFVIIMLGRAVREFWR